jgi:hypothetical protein
MNLINFVKNLFKKKSKNALPPDWWHEHAAKVKAGTTRKHPRYQQDQDSVSPRVNNNIEAFWTAVSSTDFTSDSCSSSSSDSSSCDSGSSGGSND